MPSEKRAQKKVQLLYRDESGNVLLFSVIVLMFLIFVISVVSLSVSNRVRTARKETDHNQVTAQVIQKAQDIENSIQQIVNECDELSRYYISRRYYNRDDTAFSQTGSNSSLNHYLSSLITTEFQMQIRNKMQNGIIDTTECAKILFAYLIIRRSSDPSLLPELKSVSEAIDDYRSSSLSIDEKQLQTINGVTMINPSFDSIMNTIRNGDSFMKISYKLSIISPATYVRVDRMEYQISYELSSFEYLSSGINILKPQQEEIAEVLESQKHQLITVMTP